jgi:tungstate transport system substrate-binding protein
MRWKLSVLLLAGLAACGVDGDGRDRVILVTTTTVESSGLLDELVEAYHGSQDRYRVSVTAVGSGAALEIGRRGDADLLLTHDPVGEARFMEDGHGAEQGPVMSNDFVIAGPAADPAGVRGTADLAVALERVASGRQPFVSRGDESGTHRKERELWRRAGLSVPDSDPVWYIESGSGMGETLRVADARQAYVLTDRGTFRHLSEGLRLDVLAEARPPERNPYQYTVPRQRLNPAGARDLKAWLTGPGQSVIGAYGVARFGEPLFTPAGR